MRMWVVDVEVDEMVVEVTFGNEKLRALNKCTRAVFLRLIFEIKYITFLWYLKSKKHNLYFKITLASKMSKGKITLIQ